MSLFDTLRKAMEPSPEKEAAPTVGKGQNRSQRFTFGAIPVSVAQLQALPEAALDSAFKTAALTMLVLCRYEADPEGTIAMLDFLKGPAEVSPYEKQFIAERLRSKGYKALSFFDGATPENGYEPTTPYTICISENPYSFDNENWATLYVKSGGADHPRPIKLRKKPSTGQWFLNEIQCLSDIRVPVAEDPWA